MTERDAVQRGEDAAVLDHAALVVTSVEWASAFYMAVLDLEVLGTVRLSDHTICYLSSGTGVRIELIEFDDGRRPTSVSDGKDIAPRHLAWSVRDLDRALSQVQVAGGNVHVGPVWVSELGFTSALIHDADGIESELVEYPTRREASTL